MPKFCRHISAITSVVKPGEPPVPGTVNVILGRVFGSEYFDSDNSVFALSRSNFRPSMSSEYPGNPGGTML